jgi:hypothetical protein
MRHRRHLEWRATTDSLPARLAWKIDQKSAKFVEASIVGLVCRVAESMPSMAGG